MMKKVLVVLLAIIAFSLSSFAKDIKRTLNTVNFDKIYVSSAFNVTLIQGNKHSVEVTIDDKLEEYLVLEVNRGELVLSINREKGVIDKVRKILNNAQVKATIVVPSLTGLRVSGACDIQSQGHFRLGNIDIKIGGASSLNNFSADAKEVELSANGASSINGLDLKCTEADFSITGASNIKNMKLKAEEGDFSVSGASSINGDIDAHEVDFILTGASHASIGGKVDFAEFEASGASSVKAYDLNARNVKADLSGASSANVYLTNELKPKLSGASSLSYKGPESIRVNAPKVNSGSHLEYKGAR